MSGIRRRLLALRTPLLCGVLILIALNAASGSVFAQRTMMVQASFNPTPTEQGVYVVVSGRVFDLDNVSLSNAVISIEVISPQGTSIHVAIAYTDLRGVFEDTFYMVQSSPAGNYTAFLTAEKPGYESAHLTLKFVYSTPDFSLGLSSEALTIQQGQTASLTLTVLSLRGFNDAVNLTSINEPSGVIVEFSPNSLVPSGSTIVNVHVSFMAASGNYTFEVLGVSGSLTRKATLQLRIEPGPLQSGLAILSVIVIVSVIILAVRSRKSRRRREQIIDEFLTQSTADTGYVATARVLARLEELRAMNKVDESTYQRLRKDYERRLEKDKD